MKLFLPGEKSIEQRINRNIEMLQFFMTDYCHPTYMKSRSLILTSTPIRPSGHCSAPLSQVETSLCNESTIFSSVEPFITIKVDTMKVKGTWNLYKQIKSLLIARSRSSHVV